MAPQLQAPIGEGIETCFALALASGIMLSQVDWVKLLEVLDAPPAPTDELKALFAEDWPKGNNKPFTLAE
ncbi:: DUF1778 [Gemmata massiliana]|uniref:: DUF1778 n=1 Tax=Gemmata massiliana TaxID=1210884 RepID=A0A6P2CQA4_9BACT|nr:DUF1778 domain-containing protein [Gemmata massiliana]VTR91208.1 : DUF1778 [Gemmata massiliana]